MDKLVYTAATGLKARMAAQAAIANNMANVSTTGFRADRVVFDQIQLKGGGTHDRGAVADVRRGDRRRPHPRRDPDDGASARRRGERQRHVDGGAGRGRQRSLYTARRPGRSRPSGVLQTGDGFPVMGSSGPITLPPYQSLTIASRRIDLDRPRRRRRKEPAGGRQDQAGEHQGVGHGQGPRQPAARARRRRAARGCRTPRSRAARSRGRTST